MSAQRRVPIALELYSVREAMKEDLPGTLAKVAAMGYEGVEFAEIGRAHV
jgi:sugar phosphate isomerase/epimerase